MFSGKGLGNQTITLEGGHKGSGEAGSEAAPSEVGNPSTADEGARALTLNLMESVSTREGEQGSAWSRRPVR